jgi:hypothetical protein
MKKVYCLAAFFLPVWSLTLRTLNIFLAKCHQKQTTFKQGLDYVPECVRRPKTIQKGKKLKTASFEEQDAFSGV